MTYRNVLIPLLFIAACGAEAPPAATVDKAPAPAGKLAAPVRIDYNVLGNAIVGQPVAIELRLSSPEGGRPLTLNYFINDSDALAFGSAQPESIALSIPENEGVAARQVTVVPQREGRLYLNVTVEMETANGTMLKSAAIPITVGEGAPPAEVNGELQGGADGEAVISMPAKESGSR